MDRKLEIMITLGVGGAVVASVTDIILLASGMRIPGKEPNPARAYQEKIASLVRELNRQYDPKVVEEALTHYLSQR